jgi:methyl-accepting chemotaxis protein
VSSTSSPARSGRRFGWFANRPVLVKIATSVVIVAVVAVAVGLTALSKLASVSANVDDMYRNNLQAIAALGRAQHDQSETKVDMNQYVLAADQPAKQVTRLQNIKDDDADVDEDAGRLPPPARHAGARRRQGGHLRGLPHGPLSGRRRQ